MNICRYSPKINTKFMKNIRNFTIGMGISLLVTPMSPPRIFDAKLDTFQKENTELVPQQNTLSIDIAEINTKRKMCEDLIDEAKSLGFRTDCTRNLDNITDIEELNEISDTLSKQINIRKDLINKGENLKENNSLETLRTQYPSETYEVFSTYEDNGKIIYYVISKKDKQVIKRVEKKPDYIAVGYCKDNLVIKDEFAIRTKVADSTTYTMYTEVNYKYDEKRNEIANSVKKYFPYQWSFSEKTNKWSSIPSVYIPSLLLDTKRFTNKNNQVKNNNYTGDLFDVEFNGDGAIITNKTKNQTFVLDVNKLLDNKYNNREQKQELLCAIKSLPGEVLADLAVECCMIGYFDKSTKKTFGFTKYKYSIMIVKPKDTVITHEIGHLLHNVSYIDQSWNDKFNDVFQNEQKNYLNSLKSEKDSSKHFCSKDIYEFFAEAYTYLMLGHTLNEPDDDIVKYFPNSLKMVKDRIIAIRQMDLANRNSLRYEYKSKNIIQKFMEKRDKCYRSISNFFNGLFGKEADNGADAYKSKVYKILDNDINSFH